MTKPAEKIRQVVENTIEYHFWEYMSKAETLEALFAHTGRVLDAIIEDAEYKYTDEGRIPTLASFIEELKEARNSITNSAHE